MKIYLDADFKCHVSHNNDIIKVIDTNFFDSKCDKYIEGYRFIPVGESWTREDGEIFYGEMVSPWKSYEELDAVQREYERDLAEAARILLGGN